MSSRWEQSTFGISSYPVDVWRRFTHHINHLIKTVFLHPVDGCGKISEMGKVGSHSIIPGMVGLGRVQTWWCRDWCHHCGAAYRHCSCLHRGKDPRHLFLSCKHMVSHQLLLSSAITNNHHNRKLKKRGYELIQKHPLLSLYNTSKRIW